jgi:hypothetical protein
MDAMGGKVLINGQQASSSPADAPTSSSAPSAKIGKVYINGREAVHAGCGGMAIAFPDVCLCPPGPPAGPVPVPLTNTVQAKDLVGGALTVVIQGNPAGHKDSYFAVSTGNEVSASTGGGVISHAVKGKAYFGSCSPDVVIESKPAVRHGDLLTQNHQRRNPTNCPPAVWTATVCSGQAGAPRKSVKILQEGDDWIEVDLIDEVDEPISFTPFRLKTPKETVVEGRFLWGGQVALRRITTGYCELVLPEVDELMGSVAQAVPGPTNTIRYRPGRPLKLVSGKSHRVFVAQMRTLFVELLHPPSNPTGDRFVLRSDDNCYCEVRRAGEDQVNEDGILTLAFPKVAKGPKYTLSYNDSAGSSHDVFVGLSFEEMFSSQPCSPYDEPAALPDLRFGVDQRRGGR